MSHKVAVITGITGQDGSYLAELLLQKGYHVHGFMRRSSHVPTERIAHLLSNPGLILHYCDISDSQNVYESLRKVSKIEGVPPHELYNLAAQSHVHVSFIQPYTTAQTDGIGCLNLLNAIRELEWTTTKFYQASTSELFGSALPPQSEQTPFHPRSPYAVAKMYSYWITVNYREAYNLFAVNGILFNHESPRRGVNFVTRKVTRGIGQIVAGKLDSIKLGNLNSKRDWGHAKDYVEAMWAMLQLDTPQDLVIGTGETRTIRELCVEAFAVAGIKIKFEGEGLEEVGKCEETGRILIKVDSSYFRPSEVEHLHSDPHKAFETLHWKPKISFKQLIREMVEHDMEPSKSQY